MSLRKCKKQVADNVTVYWDSEWEEFIVKLEGNPEANYHTDDKEDAYNTAVAMSKESKDKG